MLNEARQIQLEESWLSVLGDELSHPALQNLRDFLIKEKMMGKEIYPSDSLIFNALNSTPFDKVKVVILGQDPYHGPDQAHGLCFSVNPGVKIPPSLQNIFKEMHDDLNFAIPSHGYLQPWADQGVLLLNAVLTVEKGNAGSHQGKGWEGFTDRVIQELNARREGIVFLLWGSYAQKKGRIIDQDRHLVLKAPHPSPLSSYRGFFGCKHFSQTNDWLAIKGFEPIDWALREELSTE